MKTLRKIILYFTVTFLVACTEQDASLRSIAQNGNAGSLDGPYILTSIWVEDTNGGGAGFGYGAVNGYPGASADIGGIGVPTHIKGYWAKVDDNGSGLQSYYRISADIDSELAEKKIRTLQNYYQNFKSKWGRMQVEVEQSRIMVLYTQGCYDNRVDCSVREDADPNGYVIRSPSDTIDVVSLFDGQGESSATPFPGSPFDSRFITVSPFHLSQSISLIDNEGQSGKGGDSIGDLTRVQGNWSIFKKVDQSDVFTEHKFRIDKAINTATAKEKIQSLRAAFTKAVMSKKSNTYVKIGDNGNVKIYYGLFCDTGEICKKIKKDDTKNVFIKLDEVNSIGILLFEDEAEKSDTE